MSDTNDTTPTTPVPEPEVRTSQAPVITIPAHTRHMADGSTQEVKAYTKPSSKGVKLKPKKPVVPRDYKAERARYAAALTAANKRGPYNKKTKTKPTPKVERPRFTSPTHAAYIRERLSVPLAFVTTLRHMNTAQQTEMLELLYECQSIIKMAQLFIGRFTSNQPMED